MASPTRSPYYSYNILPEGHIRLLKIDPAGDPAKPSRFDEDLRVSLTSVALSSAPKFAALSYTWGDASPFDSNESLVFTKIQRCYPIYCADKLLLVTRNLRDALKRFQYIERLKHLDPKSKFVLKPGFGDMLQSQGLAVAQWYWIDSLCINQNDVQERSSQVGLMGSIYRQAHCTIVWLGEQDKYTKPAARAMLWLTEQYKSLGRNVDLQNLLNPMDDEYSPSDTLKDADLISLVSLLARNWFRRLWVIQETLLSKNITVFVGLMTMSLDNFYLAGRYFNQKRAMTSLKRRLNALKESDPNVESISTEAALTAPNRLSIMANVRDNIRYNGTFPDLLQILTITRVCQVSDERDRIYALLAIVEGLQSHGKPNIVPDYTLTPRDVFLHATCTIIQFQHDLHPLLWSSAKSLRSVQDLPSWCPDYSALTEEPLVEWIRTSFWSTKPIIEIVHQAILDVSAFRYDVMDQVVDPTPKTRTRLNHHVIAAPHGDGPAAVLRLVLRRRADEPSACTLRSSGISKVEELWRALITDEFAQQSPSPKVATIFLPLLLWVCLGGLASDSEFNHAPLTAEVAALGVVVQEVKRQQPESRSFLPDMTSADKVLANTSVAVAKEVQARITLHELEKLGDRAAVVGLTAELEILLDASPEYQAPDGQSINVSWWSKAIALVESYIVPSILGTMLHRRVFTTEKYHHFGMGSAAALPRDEIWFLHGLSDHPHQGAQVPVILRPMANGQYTFMGECYVYGVEVDDIPPQEERIANGMERRIEIV